jgi:hypothetical protein
MLHFEREGGTWVIGMVSLVNGGGLGVVIVGGMAVAVACASLGRMNGVTDDVIVDNIINRRVVDSGVGGGGGGAGAVVGPAGPAVGPAVGSDSGVEVVLVVITPNG